MHLRSKLSPHETAPCEIPAFSLELSLVFLDEQHWWERGKLRTWVEFTDPSNTLAVLTYSCDSDPFVGFQWDNPIPNPRFRAKHPGNEYSITNRGIHVLNQYTKRTK